VVVREQKVMTQTRFLMMTLVAGLVSVGTAAQSVPVSKDIPSIAKAANGSIVSIVMSDKEGKPLGQGSGFVVSTDGSIITNYHVIAEGVSAVAKFPDGAFYLIDGVVASDKDRDVAIVKAQGHNFRPLKLGNSDRVQVGEEVVAIGNPLSLESTVSNGIVSGVRSIKKEGTNYLQITAPISPGSSGGPLFNMSGEVVGITTMYLKDGENLNFAIPINGAKRLLLANSSKIQALPNETDLVKGQTHDGDAPSSGSGASRQPSTDRDYYQHLYDAGGFFIPGFTRMNGARAASTDYVCFSDDQHSGRFFTFEAKYYDDIYINALKKWFEYAGADSGNLEEKEKKAEGMKKQWDIMQNKKRELNAPYVQFDLDHNPKLQELLPNGGGYMFADVYEKGVKVNRLVYEWSGNSWVDEIFPDTKPHTKASKILQLSIEPTTMRYVESETVPTTGGRSETTGVCEIVEDGPEVK
jgi:S1-C subfamily serine protease